MNRRIALAFLAGCLLFACSKDSSKAEPSAKTLKSLTVDEVEARLAAKDGKTFIFDNNMPESYAKAHVPGAKWLDDESVTADKLPADKTATLIFYCHNET